MWKYSRTVFQARWCTSNKRHAKQLVQNVVCSKPIITHPSFEKKRSSGNEQENGENFKQSERFWNSSHFRYLLFNSSFFETAGWLGTVSILCFNVHFKHFNFTQHNDKKRSQCLFTKSALAMQDSLPKKKSSNSETPHLENHFKVPASSEKDRESTNASFSSQFLEELKDKSEWYAAALQNSIGLSFSKSNNKKAFRSFQRAAHLGSVQGFYNLGLCYELGRGTKVNLTRAAFCYRKAAMKGHGMASFNLALYFLNGLGNLPEDPETAHLLLEQAATKGVSEAELYLGLECLENEKWPEAYHIFNNLAEKNNIDGKYYLAMCIEKGWGTQKDEKMAVEIYSQNSNLNHDKSILSLSRCYEEGIACNSDLDFALVLSQTLADKGNDEAKKEVARLKEKQAILKKRESELKPPVGARKNLHGSSSDPAFAAVDTAKARAHFSSVISSYLDLVQSFIPIKSKSVSESPKPLFYVGDHNMDLNMHTMRHFPGTAPVVATKT